MSEFGYQGEGSSEVEILRSIVEGALYGTPTTGVVPPRREYRPKSTSGDRVRLMHDFEWFSDLDVTVYGISRVTRDPSTEALMCAYAFDDGRVQQWIPAEGEPMPKDLAEAMRDPEVIKQSWNKPAEWCVWSNVLGIVTPHAEWRDTMVMAMSLSLPGSLDKAGKVIGLPEDKQKSSRGKALIRVFSKPNKPTKANPFTRRDHITDPEQWQEFLEYNRLDVEAERAIYKKIRKWDLPEHEWELYALDQEINEAGLPINMAVVRNALRVNAAVMARRMNKMKRITELDNPNSGKQLLPWLKTQGYPFDDLKKGHVTRALQRIEDECFDAAVEIESRDYRRVLELRQEVSKASVKKFAALEKGTDDDGLLRYTLQFAGAGRTWRWAGRRYQAQNLARPAKWLEHCQEDAVRDLEFLDAEQIEWLYPYPMDLLSTCVRPVVQAPEGYLFADADLNAIENRILGWLADDKKILSVFAENRDPYVDFAKYMFNRPYDELFAEYKAGDKGPRTIAKPAVLGCGYMLGPGGQFENESTGEIEATGLLGYAWNMGVMLTQEQSAQSVKVWRETFVDVVEFWRAIDRAARKCIRTGDPVRCGHITFDRSGPWMRMWLPSGRALHYLRPKILQRKTPWGEMRDTITYEGLDTKNQWTRLTTHPGKLTENADQAIARDILAHGIRLARQRGLDIRLHIHDQNLALVRKETAERDLEVLRECMSEQPKWGKTMPLGSAGFTTRILTKD